MEGLGMRGWRMEGLRVRDRSEGDWGGRIGGEGQRMRAIGDEGRG